MKKLFFIICMSITSPLLCAEHKGIILCPLQLLNQESVAQNQNIPTYDHEALEKLNINETLVMLTRLIAGIITLSSQPHNAVRVGAEVASVIASLMATTSTTAVQNKLSGTNSLAKLCAHLRFDTRKIRPLIPAELLDTNDKAVRDAVLGSFVNMLGSIASITANPHDHKFVASQATLMLANILNVVKETIKSPTVIPTDSPEYRAFAQDFNHCVVDACTHTNKINNV